jgi:pimeloyl-ACP methyl ester carboxylesterase
LADWTTCEQTISIPAGGVDMAASLNLGFSPQGVVLFAHGSGSNRHSPRNRTVAQELLQAHLATLLPDLLSGAEQASPAQAARLAFAIPLLAARLVASIDWLRQQRQLADLPLGLFGASTGAAVALTAAARRPESVRAVVCRGGRPDLAPAALELVRCPVMLIVGERDKTVLDCNRLAAARLRTPHSLAVIPRAGHLFEEAGTLEAAGWLARRWFLRHLPWDSETDSLERQPATGADPIINLR